LTEVSFFCGRKFLEVKSPPGSFIATRSEVSWKFMAPRGKRALSLDLSGIQDLINNDLPKMFRMADDMHNMASYLNDMRIIAIFGVVMGAIAGIAFILHKLFSKRQIKEKVGDKKMLVKTKLQSDPVEKDFVVRKGVPLPNYEPQVHKNLKAPGTPTEL